ncbi:hypothetical protein R5R35_005096 [Gryllus longicercus]|uniref:Protein zwilch n=1 Tax=Gryllus longicercus TaxID=2509291 RepID=A0AAN9Z1D5_9ORTH
MSGFISIKLNDILADFVGVQLQKSLPSYIQIFLSKAPEDAIFIYKGSVMQQAEVGNIPDLEREENIEFSGELDVTGSPLQFSNYSVNVDDSVLCVKKFWLDDEEKHYPLSLNSARSIISRYLLKVENCNIPLWIACDGTDKSRTLLLCGFKEEGWCSRCLVQYHGLSPLTRVDEELNDTTLLFSNKKQRKVNVQCIFDLCDYNFEKTFELTQNEVSSRNGQKMLVKLEWHGASVKVPTNGVSSVLTVGFKIGDKSSAIFSLWSQLNSLSKYYEILCSLINDKQSIVLPRKCSADEILLENVTKKILALINSPDDVVGSLPQGSDLSHEKLRENILSILIKQVNGCMRPDCDITDKIWLVLNELIDVESITACLNNLLSILEDGKSKLQASLRKKSLLSNIISSVLNGNLALNNISMEKTLEVMVESGFEKLKYDYDYVFKKLGVNCSNYFKNISISVAKSLDAVEHNINILAQIHVALDFILRVQYFFDSREHDLNAFAQAIFKESCKTVTSLKNLQCNPHVSLEVPVEFECVVDQLPSYFSSLKMETSSINEEDCDYSVLFLSSQSLFPPALMQFEGEKEADATYMEQQYHVYKLSSYCDYIGKQ